MLDRTASLGEPLIEMRSPSHKGSRKDQRKLADLTKRFKSAMKQSLEGILQAGDVLIEAKRALPHGKWLSWVEQDLKIGIRSAQILMFIARNPVISNATHESLLLPVSPRTLYELSQFQPARLSALISSGRITPGLTREEAVALRHGAVSKQERLTAPKLKHAIATLVNVCLVLGGSDVVLAYIRGLEDISTIAPTAKELRQAAVWAKHKLATRCASQTSK
jgi:hypothetical protein